MAVLLRLVLSQRLTRSPTANHFTRPRQLRVLSSQQPPCELRVWLGLHRSTETYSLLFPDQCRERPTTRTTYNSTAESAEFDTCLTVCAQWCTETTVPGRNGVFLWHSVGSETLPSQKFPVNNPQSTHGRVGGAPSGAAQRAPGTFL